MKKKICSLVLLVLLAFTLFASDDKITTRPIALQAGFDVVTAIYVERIPSQTESYLQGMPFNIEDPQVKYVDNGLGRRIANWSVLSNASFSLIFELEPLKHALSSSADNVTPLPYILTFEYILSYGYESTNYVDSKFILDMGAKETTLSAYGKTTTGEKTSDGNVVFSVDITENLSTSEGFIGNLDGGVYFMFTKESSEKLAADDPAKIYPYGSYEATVKIWVEVKQ